MPRRYLLLICAAALSLAAAEPSATRPDLSGTWRMDPKKSDFGAMPAPSEFVRVIEAKGTSLHVSKRQVGQKGESLTEFTIPTNGIAHETKISGFPAVITARWIGKTLSVETKRKIGPAEITLSELWMLSAGQKAMTIEATATTPQGELPLRIYLVKQQ